MLNHSRPKKARTRPSAVQVGTTNGDEGWSSAELAEARQAPKPLQARGGWPFLNKCLSMDPIHPRCNFGNTRGPR